MNRKLKIISLLYILMIIPNVVFASDDSYSSISKLLNGLLDALAWFGYAIALGALLLVGVKYVMSGAQERANLKGKFITYFIGIALIVLCSTIAAGVAEIANKDGKTTAGNLVDIGFQMGGIQVGASSTGVGSTNNSSLSVIEGNATVVGEAEREIVGGNGSHKYTNYDDGTIVDTVVNENDEVVEKWYDYEYNGDSYSLRTVTYSNGKTTEEIYEDLKNANAISLKLEDDKFNPARLSTTDNNISDNVDKYEIPFYNKDGEKTDAAYKIDITDNGDGNVEVRITYQDNDSIAGYGSVNYYDDGRVEGAFYDNDNVALSSLKTNIAEGEKLPFYDTWQAGINAGAFQNH